MKTTPEQRPEVVQVDREAAVALHRAARGAITTHEHDYHCRILEGRRDDGSLVQAFAAHRIAAEKDALESIAREAERQAEEAYATADACDYEDHRQNWFRVGNEHQAFADRLRASHPERRSENG